jgi:hypothetical protein
MLNVFMEKNVPFVSILSCLIVRQPLSTGLQILSYASPFASIPDEISAEISRSGLGVVAQWSPQQVILSHSVSGYVDI